ncbi:MAG: hypothetical protein HC769_20010 [Cyanobacteria bacterium CRU_2_1]|nr:hypothetical protein [Cyanobacteria bacterium RU_5_0]NJR60904.1 hypothetical protein [Cyanobacteria bacterium CRU_2_1]
MPDTGIQVCPICGVKILKIIGGDRVMFSAGPPGTRAILWARVCQYTEKRGCINRDKEAIGNVKPQDYYQSEV